MKKLISVLLIASMILTILAGCSKEKPKQPDDTTVTGEIKETTTDTTDVFTDYEGRDDLYTAAASSGITMPEMRADWFYLSFPYEFPFTYRYYYKDVNDIPYHEDVFVSDTLNQKVNEFIITATDELSKISKDEIQAYLETIGDNYRTYPYTDNFEDKFFLEKKMINGYFSVLVAVPYFDIDTVEVYYYDVRTAVFDIYTEEELEFSDMFFDGVDFVPILNNYLAKKTLEPYYKNKMKRDFSGLAADNFAFTVDSIIFMKNSDFANNGVTVSFSEYRGSSVQWPDFDPIMGYMVTSVPRDMSGYLKDGIEVYREILCVSDNNYESKETADLLYLKSEIPFATEEACNKVNAFIDNLYESYFSPEKFNEVVPENVVIAEDYRPEFNTHVIGERYISLEGQNFVLSADKNKYYYFLDGFETVFHYYFDAKTGEELTLNNNSLFSDGWKEAAEYYYEDGFNGADAATWVKYDRSFDISGCTIMNIANYESSAAVFPPLSCDEEFVYIHVKAEDGEKAVILIPREYIK